MCRVVVWPQALQKLPGASVLQLWQVLAGRVLDDTVFKIDSFHGRKVKMIAQGRSI
jgi:hypothetical protein